MSLTIPCIWKKLETGTVTSFEFEKILKEAISETWRTTFQYREEILSWLSSPVNKGCRMCYRFPKYCKREKYKTCSFLDELMRGMILEKKNLLGDGVNVAKALSNYHNLMG